MSVESRLRTMIRMKASMEPLSGESGMLCQALGFRWYGPASMEPLSGESGMSADLSLSTIPPVCFNGATLRREWNVGG